MPRFDILEQRYWCWPPALPDRFWRIWTSPLDLGFCIRSLASLPLSSPLFSFRSASLASNLITAFTTRWKLRYDTHLYHSPICIPHDSRCSSHTFPITTTYQISSPAQTLNHSVDTIPNHISGTSFQFYYISASYLFLEEIAMKDVMEVWKGAASYILS